MFLLYNASSSTDFSKKKNAWVHKGDVQTTDTSLAGERVAAATRWNISWNTVAYFKIF